MSVVVIGMEMPKTCNDCLICCEHSMLYKAIDDKRSPKCPLRPLPDAHGDLIDRRQLVERFVPRQAYFTDTIKEKIETAPTIVEAEE